MANERGAGRKPSISARELCQIRKRHEAGETLTELAKIYGVSRQTLSKYMNQKNSDAERIGYTLGQWVRLNRQFRKVNVADYPIRMEYMCREECCTVILANFKDRKIVVCNTTDDLLHRAFGIKAKPDWKDFEEFLESRCFPRSRDGMRLILKDLELDFYDPLSIIEKTQGRMAEDAQWIHMMYLQKKYDERLK